MRVWIDHDLCTGDGRCEEICPQVFTLVDGIAHVRSGASDAGATTAEPREVREVHIDAVLAAAEDCPGECIFVDV